MKNNTPFETYNYLKSQWKKMSATRDDVELEESFMTQAQAFVQNKARPLFKEPYLLGFEIVHRPDNSNTRMVGMYAFRINKSLYYVPIIFSIGEIKGVESIYNESEKMFYPLNAGWCEHILSKEDKEEGKPIDRDKANERNVGLDADKTLNYDGGNTKKASAVFKEMVEVAQKALTKDNSDLLEKTASIHGLSFISDLTKYAEINDDVAEGLATLVDLDTILETAVKSEPNLKKQASTVEPELKLHLGKFTKSASFDNLDNGYSIEDNRPSDKIASVSVKSENAFRSVADIGKVEQVLFSDGSLREVVPLVSELEESEDSCPSISTYPYENSSYNINYFYDIKEQKIIGNNLHRSPAAALDEVSVELYDHSAFKDKPRGGKTFIAILPSGYYIILHNVVAVNRKENITSITISLKSYDHDKDE